MGSMSGSQAMMRPPGGSMAGSVHDPTNILPPWLAVVWGLVFAAVLVMHVRHLLDSHGQRRAWHCGHVLMALGMVFMSAQAAIDSFNPPSGVWQIAFVAGAALSVAWMLSEDFRGHAINALWLVMTIDLVAMAYMWSPNLHAALTWVVVVYFAAQSALWASNRMRRLDRRTLPGGVSVTPDGAIATAVAQPLICYRDLRASMTAMTFGTAYLFAAMQLMS